ncbi:MAG: hypothetical protein LBI84_02565, partial [Propionibacteriaceae bacterium]|nr:hypothetical protein [Propionibacteriaceae bacterium]
PTGAPTAPPTPSLTASPLPSASASATPTTGPTSSAPSASPTAVATASPTAAPSSSPVSPTGTPTAGPSPTAEPTAAASPTASPTAAPSATAEPTAAPSAGSRLSLVVTLDGSVFTVAASGFEAGEQVSGVVYSDPFSIGSTTADAQGAVRLSWTMPAGAASGPHRVVLTGERSGSAEQAFVFGGDLPGTGLTPSAAHLALGGLGFLALAGLSLFAVARRRTARP